jgi:hypothetical protein
MVQADETAIRSHVLRVGFERAVVDEALRSSIELLVCALLQVWAHTLSVAIHLLVEPFDCCVKVRDLELLFAR